MIMNITYQSLLLLENRKDGFKMLVLEYKLDGNKYPHIFVAFNFFSS